MLRFYIGKYRANTLLETVTFSRGPMSDDVVDAASSSHALAGPYIDGYAFCSPDKQARINTASIDWVEANPCLTIHAPGLAGRVKPGGIEASIAKSIASIRVSATREATQMADPTLRAEFMERRKANGMDAQFCWTACAPVRQ